MLGPADIEAWREDAEDAGTPRLDAPRRPSDDRESRRPPFPMARAVLEMLAWRDRLFGHRP